MMMRIVQLSWHQAQLSLNYRTRLTQHVHDNYLAKLTFYGISALDDRIKNPDQVIAVDVARFSNSLAELYSNLAKPMLDMVCKAISTHSPRPQKKKEKRNRCSWCHPTNVVNRQYTPMNFPDPSVVKA